MAGGKKARQQRKKAAEQAAAVDALLTAAAGDEPSSASSVNTTSAIPAAAPVAAIAASTSLPTDTTPSPIVNPEPPQPAPGAIVAEPSSSSVPQLGAFTGFEFAQSRPSFPPQPARPAPQTEPVTFGGFSFPGSETQVRELKAEIERLKQDHEKERNQLEDDHFDEIEDLNEEHANTVDVLEGNNKRLKEQAEYDWKQVEQAQAQTAELEKQLKAKDDLINKLHNDQRNDKKAIDDLQKERDDFERDRNEVRASRDSAQASLKHDRDIMGELRINLSKSQAENRQIHDAKMEAKKERDQLQLDITELEEVLGERDDMLGEATEAIKAAENKHALLSQALDEAFYYFRDKDFALMDQSELHRTLSAVRSATTQPRSPSPGASPTMLHNPKRPQQHRQLSMQEELAAMSDSDGEAEDAGETTVPGLEFPELDPVLKAPSTQTGGITSPPVMPPPAPHAAPLGFSRIRTIYQTPPGPPPGATRFYAVEHKDRDLYRSTSSALWLGLVLLGFLATAWFWVACHAEMAFWMDANEATRQAVVRLRYGGLLQRMMLRSRATYGVGSGLKG